MVTLLSNTDWNPTEVHKYVKRYKDTNSLLIDVGVFTGDCGLYTIAFITSIAFGLYRPFIVSLQTECYAKPFADMSRTYKHEEAVNFKFSKVCGC